MYSDRIERAIRLALAAHGGQFRKADAQVPYIAHPIHVALIVQEAGGNEDAVIAALLHDLLEDTTVTPEDLEAEFGHRVSAIVQEVSEDKSLPWPERKARMVERLKTASVEACLISGADKIHNLETLIKAHARYGPSIWNAFRGKPEETMRFAEQVFDALRGRIPEEMESAFARALNAGQRLLAPAA